MQFIYDNIAKRCARSIKAMGNPKLLWSTARYMIPPIFLALCPFPSTFVNDNKHMPSPFIELLLDEGFLQVGFLCHDFEVPDPKSLGEEAIEDFRKQVRKASRNNFSSRPHMHYILDASFIGAIEEAFVECLSNDMTLFGTGLLSSDTIWKKAMKGYIVEVTKRMEKWVGIRKRDWSDHPAELRVLDQIGMKLEWILNYKIFDSFDVGMHFPNSPKPLLTPTLIQTVANQLLKVSKGYLFVSQ